MSLKLVSNSLIKIKFESDSYQLNETSFITP